MESNIDQDGVVLCVDDDEQVRRMVRAVLQTAGHPVVEAANLESACRLILGKNPSLAILDVDLPDGTGFDLARHFRQNGNPTLPILMISGRDKGESENEVELLDE